MGSHLTDEVYNVDELFGNEFPQLGDTTYLDHAGATLYSRTQIDAVREMMLTSLSCNPHTRVEDAKRIDEIRDMVLRHFHTNSDEYSVVFTSGATAAIKLVGECFPWSNSSELRLLEDCHTSILGLRQIAISKQATVNICRWASFLSKSKENTRLCCFPAMSNFNGRKYPLSIIPSLQSETSFVLLDAASFVSTNNLDLSVYQPDFVALSFYKMFGYPTGLGALLVRHDSSNILRKDYFGGGTVDLALVRNHQHFARKDVCKKFEDGTIDFLGISSLSYGFEALNKVPGGMKSISKHTFSLAKYAVAQMCGLEHFNGGPAVKIYCEEDSYSNELNYGGIVNFNLLSSDGAYVGFSSLNLLCQMNNIILRTGCFCNTGSCQKYLSLSDEDMLEMYRAGHVCGDNVDMFKGHPTGSVRISFGYMSRRQDVDTLVTLIRDNFVESAPENDNLSLNGDKGEVEVDGLFVYPVKSCGGMSVGSWRIMESGLQYDRGWMILQGRKVLTQKIEPLLSQIQTSIDLETEKMTLRFRESTFELSIKDSELTKEACREDICIGNVCGQEVEALDCGPEASEWLEFNLGIPDLKLVRGLKRKSQTKDGSLSLSNDSSCLVLNVASLEELRETIIRKCIQTGESSEEFTIENITQRFRGNIIIRGAPAFIEENWAKVQCDQFDLEVLGACKRCKMISIEQNSGETTTEPLRSLALMKNRNFNFGIHTKPTINNDTLEEIFVKVGERVKVL